MTKGKIELLAPAGSYESMQAAIHAGADAVYMGGTLFGARAFADNPEENKMKQAIDYAHIHGRRLYLTVNTLLKDRELEKLLYSYLKPLYKQGLDAVIVQDMGVFQYIRDQFPDLPIHASTQMTITGTAGVRFLQKHGAERVVLARELNLNEIKEIKKETDTELECFVHGALCYSYSGQCLYSSLVGGRSGNRGRCAQPCRLPYQITENGRVIEEQSKHWMSLKDMCTLELIPDFIDAGIYSFKIEGRMKHAQYAAGTTAVYRKYMDQYMQKGREGYRIQDEDRKLLFDLYNRGGFSTGYFEQNRKPLQNMYSLQRPNHYGLAVGKVHGIKGNSLQVKMKETVSAGDLLEFSEEKKDGRKNGDQFTCTLQTEKEKILTIPVQNAQRIKAGTLVRRMRNQSLLDRLHDTFLEQKLKEKINGSLIISQGFSAILEVSYKEEKVHVTGEVVQKSQNQPMQEETVRKQMLKTGDTPFVFETLNIQLDRGCFLPVKSLNELRRNALEKLEQNILSQYKRLPREQIKGIQTTQIPIRHTQRIHALVNTREQFHAVLDIPEITSIYVESALISFSGNEDRTGLQEMAKACHTRGKECMIALPHIFRNSLYQAFSTVIKNMDKSDVDGILIRNLEQLEIFGKQMTGKKHILDHNVYTFNRRARSFYKNEGIDLDTAPLELNVHELEERGCIGSEGIVYGHLPMMITAQCLKKAVRGCKQDNLNKGMPVLWLKDRYQKEFPVINHCNYCYNIIYNCDPLILLEQDEEVCKLGFESIRLNFTIEQEKEVKKIAGLFRDRYIKGIPVKNDKKSFTKGHFKRGVE